MIEITGGAPLLALFEKWPAAQPTPFDFALRLTTNSFYVLSPDALQDLQGIWHFVALDNEKAADRLEDELFNAFEKLARQLGMGHARPDLTERNVRFWPTGSYLIVYRERPEALRVLAVLHGSRDVPEVMRKREYPPS